jgi:hypothetical protein
MCMYVLELTCFRASPNHLGTIVRRGGEPLLSSLRRRFPGLRRLDFMPVGDGSWIQLSFWTSRKAAEAAEAEVLESPEMRDWLAQLDEFADAA